MTYLRSSLGAKRAVLAIAIGRNWVKYAIMATCKLSKDEATIHTIFINAIYVARLGPKFTSPQVAGKKIANLKSPSKMSPNYFLTLHRTSALRKPSILVELEQGVRNKQQRLKLNMTK